MKILSKKNGMLLAVTLKTCIFATILGAMETNQTDKQLGGATENKTVPSQQNMAPNHDDAVAEMAKSGRIKGTWCFGSRFTDTGFDMKTYRTYVTGERAPSGLYRGNEFVRENGYLPQSELAELFIGEKSTYGVFYCEEYIKIEHVVSGPAGKLVSGTIIKGKIEQDGKFYGPGTIFKDGVPDQDSIIL